MQAPGNKVAKYCSYSARQVSYVNDMHFFHSDWMSKQPSPQALPESLKTCVDPTIWRYPIIPVWPWEVNYDYGIEDIKEVELIIIIYVHESAPLLVNTY